MDSNSVVQIDNHVETEELTGYEPVLGGGLTEKAVWVDESRCIGCRYCAHVATNTFVVDDDNGFVHLLIFWKGSIFTRGWWR